MKTSLNANFINYNIPIIRYSLPCYYILCSAEASSNLQRYDGIRYGGDRKYNKSIQLDITYDDPEEMFEPTSEGFHERVKEFRGKHFGNEVQR